MFLLLIGVNLLEALTYDADNVLLPVYAIVLTLCSFEVLGWDTWDVEDGIHDAGYTLNPVGGNYRNFLPRFW